MKANHLNPDAFRDQLKRLLTKKNSQYWRYYEDGFAVVDGGREGKAKSA